MERPRPSTAHSAQKVEAFIRGHDGKRNLYYSVNPTRTALRPSRRPRDRAGCAGDPALNRKAAKTDIAAVEYALADPRS
jgi:hypothetical protein